MQREREDMTEDSLAAAWLLSITNKLAGVFVPNWLHRCPDYNKTDEL